MVSLTLPDSPTTGSPQLLFLFRFLQFPPQPISITILPTKPFLPQPNFFRKNDLDSCTSPLSSTSSDPVIKPPLITSRAGSSLNLLAAHPSLGLVREHETAAATANTNVSATTLRSNPKREAGVTGLDISDDKSTLVPCSKDRTYIGAMLVSNANDIKLYPNLYNQRRNPPTDSASCLRSTISSSSSCEPFVSKSCRSWIYAPVSPPHQASREGL